MTRGAFKITVLRNVDEGCPAGQRYVAHAFDEAGRHLVAVKFGPDQTCGETLARFLHDRIARAQASSARRGPQQMRAIRSRRRQE